MKICLFVATYSISGVPLAQSRLAVAFARLGHDVELVFGSVPAGLQLPALNGVRVKELKSGRAISMFWPIVRILQNDKPTIVFSAEDHLNFIVLAALVFSRSRAKFSGSSRVVPTDRDAYSGGIFSKGTVMKILARLLWWRADVLTCVSNDMASMYRKLFPGAKHVCVYNIIGCPESREKSRELVQHPWFGDSRGLIVVSAGRFDPEKGFDVLLRAFHRVRSVAGDARLILLGDGPERATLEKMTRALGLSNCVSFVGYVSNPLAYFSRSHVFVLSSYGEGMPNVLIEAMSCGCTVVSTDCPTGPREVLGSDSDRLVAMGDDKALADGILHAARCRVTAEELLHALAPFEEDYVVSRHFELLRVTSSQPMNLLHSIRKEPN